jgi:hypothetical protein
MKARKKLDSTYRKHGIQLNTRKKTGEIANIDNAGVVSLFINVSTEK